MTASSFTANWTSVGGATGYRLDVSTSSTFVTYVPGYQNLDVGNTTSRNVTGLTRNTNYYYRLRAYNGNGTSPNSNVIKVKTKRPLRSLTAEGKSKKVGRAVRSLRAEACAPSRCNHTERRAQDAGAREVRSSAFMRPYVPGSS